MLYLLLGSGDLEPPHSPPVRSRSRGVGEGEWVGTGRKEDTGQRGLARWGTRDHAVENVSPKEDGTVQRGLVFPCRSSSERPPPARLGTNQLKGGLGPPKTPTLP